MKTKQKLLLALLSFCTLPFSLSTASAQGTAFTYQGQLSAGGNPATGNYDFTFALFNTNSTNTGQVGATLTNLDVGVSNGLFIVTLDFGAGIFTGSNYWLEIGVRTNGGATFAALNPLQELTPTPYAIYTAKAGSAESVGATNITGIIPIAQLPGVIITNNEMGVTLGNATLNGSLSVPSNIYSGGSLLLHSDGNQNFFTGTSAGSATTGGQYNTATGYEALYTNTSGSYNTADGNQALYNNTGADNTAVGAGALSLNTSGGNNIALGYQAGFNITGSGNIDIGNEGLAGENNIIRIGSGQTTSYIAGVMLHSDGNQNFFTGTSAGSATTSGQYNTANGYWALYTNTSGSYNTADGNQALYNNTGTGNTAVGAGALSLNTSGGNNIALGYQAGFNITGSGNIDIGNEGLAGENNTIRIGTPGTQTTTYIAGVINSPTLTNATLNNATFNGTLSGTINGATFDNATINGSLSVPGSIYSGGSLLLHSDGNQNFFTGTSAGSATTGGQYNTANGYWALYTNTSGSYNTADGNQALYNNTGTGNTAVGAGALSLNTSGGNNIALGYQAGFNITGSGNIDIGNEGLAGENNTIRLGGSQTMTYIAGVINFPVISNAVVTNSIFGGNGGGLTNLSVSGSQLTSIGNSEAGYDNFFAGPSSGNPNNTGFYNTAYGTVALPSSTTGSDNAAFGYEPLFFDTTGSDNIGLGFQVLFDNRSGNQNIAIGTQALLDLGQNGHLGGTNNIALGYQAGISYITNESGNIDIGSAGVQGENNTIHLGGTQTMTYIAGVINGNGSGLTSLNAAQLSGSIPSGVSVPAANLTGAGTLPGAVLPGNVALLNGNQTFTNVDTFSNGLTVATSAGSLALINDGGAVPGITATGGLAVGHMRLRNAMEVWPNAAQTSAGYLDVRNTATTATISLTGSTGAIVCSNVTANGVVLTSDRNAKQNFTPLDPEAALAKVSAMPVTEWNYKSDPAGTKHIGPMAQDFHAAFGLNGGDDTHISVIDEGGVALAAIQGLNQKLNEKDAEIEKLKKQLDDLTATVKLLAARK